MKKTLLSVCLIAGMNGFAQTTIQKPAFDANAALLEAQQKNISPKDIDGYVEFKRREWIKHTYPVIPLTPAQTQQPGSHQRTTAAAVNIDFETGTYAGWQLIAGSNDLNSFSALTNTSVVSGGPLNDPTNNCTPTTRQAIMTSSASVDPICNSTLQSPIGGNYVARLNRSCTMYEGSILEQTFTVDNVNTILNYAYLTILEDGGHLQGEQPYFSAVVLDQLGDTIPNSFVYIQAQNGLTPGFIPTGPGSYVFYKPWTPVSVNLSAYQGQNVTLRYTSAACIYAGHSGYAYVDAKMDSISYTPNVWPGDANYDLTCNLNDLFYLGWAYGATGPARSGASNAWIAQPSTNWGTNTAYGTEFKHADCNGDGTVNLGDTAAIVLNYSLAHAFRQSNTSQQNAVDNVSSVNRNLMLYVASNEVTPVQTVHVSVSVPPSSIPANDKIYGVSFRVNLPAAYIQKLNTSNYAGSFLGVNNSNMICLVKPNVSGGFIEYGFVRRDHQNSVNAGNLFSFDLIAKAFTAAGTGQINLSDIKAVTYEGTELTLGSNVLNLNFEMQSSTGLTELSNDMVQVFPNPATESITISIPAEGTFDVEVTDLLGRSVLKTQAVKNQPIDISMLSKGMYLLKGTINGHVITKQFMKD